MHINFGYLSLGSKIQSNSISVYIVLLTCPASLFSILSVRWPQSPAISYAVSSTFFTDLQMTATALKDVFPMTILTNFALEPLSTSQSQGGLQGRISSTVIIVICVFTHQAGVRFTTSAMSTVRHDVSRRYKIPTISIATVCAIGR